MDETTADPGQRVVVVTGPTALGKSSLALEIAGRIGCDIVNADSMQVYRGMDIGTAKPSREERERVPHHLFDVVDPDQEFNAALYRSLALPVLRGISDRGRHALIVGGTGLYIKTLLGGLLECPPTDAAFREELNREWDAGGSAAMHERLMGLDPESARRIHPHDRVRVIRALEVSTLTGKPLSSLIERHRFENRAFKSLKICLQIDRDRLYHRIDHRCTRMIESGLVEETQALMDEGYGPDLKPMKALGYRHAVRHLQGEWSLDKTLERLCRDTRRYAKRQLTWFRADPEMQWISIDAAEEVFRRIEAFVDARSSAESVS